MKTKIILATLALIIASPFLIFAQEAPVESSAETDDHVASITTEEIILEDPVIETSATTTTEEDIATTTEETEELIIEDYATSTEEITAATSTEMTEAATTTEDISASANSDTSLSEEAATTTEETATTTATSSSTITSGHAVALANILNIINTNFINSNGVILFSNFFEYLKDTLDFRDALSGNSVCSQAPCTGGEEVSINISNDAAIDNAIVVDASSGGNSIDNADNATIDTGDAYAGLNLVNLANNNFVDSNYLLVTLNAFSGVGGDIVFPSLENFFGSLGGGGSPSEINLENQAEINNNVITDANSGDNQTGDTASSTIDTGDSHSSVNVFNEINSTLAGGTKISILFRIHGNWAGEIFGAPPGLSWMQGDGSIFLFDTASPDGLHSTSSNNTSVTGTSTALINNDLSVIALTGDNQITDADTALITTGNAYAGANIVNIANSNVIGKNWILAIINIFGDFDGNISFGRPDLWTGEMVETPDEIKDGDLLTYKFTVINNGDSRSSNTSLVNTYDQEHLEILDSSLPYTVSESGQLMWDLGLMPASGATEISYRAKIINAGYDTEIINAISVTGHETDNNPEDNSDSITIATAPEPRSGSRRIRTVEDDAPKAPAKQLTVTRNKLITTLHGDEAAYQKLIIKNLTPAPIPAVILHDVLKDPSGQIIRDEVWDLGTILANEEITLSYNIQFAKDAPRGLYTLVTMFDGFKNDTLPNGYVWLKPAELVAIPASDEALEPDLSETASTTSIVAAVTPQIALAAAVGSNTKTSIPKITFPLITLVVILGTWSGYKYKFGR